MLRLTKQTLDSSTLLSSLDGFIMVIKNCEYAAYKKTTACAMVFVVYEHRLIINQGL